MLVDPLFYILDSSGLYRHCQLSLDGSGEGTVISNENTRVMTNWAIYTTLLADHLSYRTTYFCTLIWKWVTFSCNSRILFKREKRQITCLEPQRRVHRATGNEYVSWENRGAHFRVWPEEEGDVKGPVCTDIQVCSSDWWLNRDECPHMQSEFGYIWEMNG